jgi:hypothetical protein
MSQKSSVPQAASFVSWALKRDSPPVRIHQCPLFVSHHCLVTQRHLTAAAPQKLRLDTD